MNHHTGSSPSPTQPRNGHGHNSRKVSQRGLMSIVMLVISVCTLGIAMFGGAKMVYDILLNHSDVGFVAPAIALGIAYLVGWFTAMVGIRVFGNLILPILINLFTVMCLLGICYLYIEIMQRLYLQQYGFGQFIKYAVVMIAGLLAMVGLHLIVEDHNLRPLSIPLLFLCMVQLGLIVYRYVFRGSEYPVLILFDLLFLLGMSAFSVLMLAHVGLLDPLRNRFTNYFDRNSKSLRTQD
jgi:hypothetical protein